MNISVPQGSMLGPYTAAFQFFIESNFVIIIYIPYTCLCDCYKHMLCSMYMLFSATTQTIYTVIVSNNMNCCWRFLHQVLTSEKVDYIF